MALAGDPGKSGSGGENDLIPLPIKRSLKYMSAVTKCSSTSSSAISCLVQSGLPYFSVDPFTCMEKLVVVGECMRKEMGRESGSGTGSGSSSL